MTDREYITVDELRKATPKAVSSEFMNGLARNFELAVSFAESCELGKMTENLMWIGEVVEGIVNEAHFGLRKRTISEVDHHDFIRKLEEFQHGTVVKAIKDTLVKECNCKLL